MITLAKGVGSADGIGAAAGFRGPRSVAVSSDNQYLYVADNGNHRIRQLHVPTLTITTIAGRNRGYLDGVGTAALFENPGGVLLSHDDMTLFVTTATHHVRQIDLSSRSVTTVAGCGSRSYVDGIGTDACFGGPTGMALSPDGRTLYVVERNNGVVRQVDLASRNVTNLVGQPPPIGNAYANGVGTLARFYRPRFAAITPDGTTLFVTDSGNNRIRRVDIATRQVSTLAGGGRGSADGWLNQARFTQPEGVAVANGGATIYVSDNNNNKIREIEITSETAGRVTTLAGSGIQGYADGTGVNALFGSPRGIAIAPDGGALYVADFTNHAIREVTLAMRRTRPAAPLHTNARDAADVLSHDTGSTAAFATTLANPSSFAAIIAITANVANVATLSANAHGPVRSALQQRALRLRHQRKLPLIPVLQRE